jgi:hypothetical protein
MLLKTYLTSIGVSNLQFLRWARNRELENKNWWNKCPEPKWLHLFIKSSDYGFMPQANIIIQKICIALLKEALVTRSPSEPELNSDVQNIIEQLSSITEDLYLSLTERGFNSSTSRTITNLSSGSFANCLYHVYHSCLDNFGGIPRISRLADVITCSQASLVTSICTREPAFSTSEATSLAKATICDIIRYFIPWDVAKNLAERTQQQLAINSIQVRQNGYTFSVMDTATADYNSFITSWIPSSISFDLALNDLLIHNNGNAQISAASETTTESSDAPAPYDEENRQ